MKQSSLRNYFKKPRLDFQQDTSPTTEEDVFPTINCLLRVLVTLPVTSCSVERLFSVVNRIKAISRATMLTDRLNSLSLLMFEKELAEKLDSDEVINAFKAKPRRLAL